MEGIDCGNIIALEGGRPRRQAAVQATRNYRFVCVWG